MHPFASPDFGAGANLALLALAVYGGIFVLAGIGLYRASFMRKDESPGRRRAGLILTVVCVFVPVSCCLAPPVGLRIATGTYPVGHLASSVKVGMTKGEVLTLLGKPRDVAEWTDAETWYYDSHWLSLDSMKVSFGPDGRVSFVSP